MHFAEAKLFNKMVINTKSHKWRMFRLVSIISYFDNKKWDFVAESYFIYWPLLFMHALVVHYLFHWSQKLIL